MPLQQIFQVAFSPHFPPVFTHLSNHKVLEDDNIFLHHQGQTMSPGGKQDALWSKRFYTPTNSDAAVLCYHRWLQEMGGAVCWARPGRQEEPKSREELVERLRSHTQHCESCSQALSLSKDLQRLGELLVILGLLTSSLLELKWSSAVLTILAAVVVGLSRELEKQLTMGDYPPPRNR